MQGVDGRDGEPRVPAAVGHGAEVGGDPGPEPVVPDVRADGDDRARDLAPGDRGEARRGQGAGGLAAAQGGVQQVHAERAGGDEHLSGAGHGVGDLLEDEGLGRAVGVVADDVHAAML